MNRFLSDEEKQELSAWRRDFHAHPELGYQETRTSAIVAEHLRSCGLEVTTGIGTTGVLGFHRGRSSGKTILLRADMDCLPVQEENEVPYASQNPGRMHACGHDGHTAALMAVAKKLRQGKSPENGSIKLVFQPAEEGGNGAEKMIQEGVLKSPKVDATFAMHVWNDHPVGKVALNRGALMAGVDSFEILIQGKGGHGAAPHQTIDAIVAASQVVVNLQTVVSRNIDPLETVVVSVGSIHGGNSFNVIAEKVTLVGTARYFSPAVGDQLPRLIERVVRGTTESCGATCEFQYDRTTPPTINHPEMADLVQKISAEVVGEQNVIMDARTMGGEDYAFFLREVPGCFFFVGSANPDRRLNYPHHSPRFDFDESALEIGAEILYRIALHFTA